MKTSELLTEAHDYLAEHGHCKGDLRTEDGRVCLSGAIAGALVNRGMLSEMNPHMAVVQGVATLWNDAGRAIAREVGEDISLMELPEWNDAPSTTKEDVLLMMKRAAHTCEENGD